MAKFKTAKEYNRKKSNLESDIRLECGNWHKTVNDSIVSRAIQKPEDYPKLAPLIDELAVVNSELSRIIIRDNDLRWYINRMFEYINRMLYNRKVEFTLTDRRNILTLMDNCKFINEAFDIDYARHSNVYGDYNIIAKDQTNRINEIVAEAYSLCKDSDKVSDLTNHIERLMQPERVSNYEIPEDLLRDFSGMSITWGTPMIPIFEIPEYCRQKLFVFS